MAYLNTRNVFLGFMGLGIAFMLWGWLSTAAASAGTTLAQMISAVGIFFIAGLIVTAMGAWIRDRMMIGAGIALLVASAIGSIPFSGITSSIANTAGDIWLFVVPMLVGITLTAYGVYKNRTKLFVSGAILMLLAVVPRLDYGWINWNSLFSGTSEFFSISGLLFAVAILAAVGAYVLRMKPLLIVVLVAGVAGMALRTNFSGIPLDFVLQWLYGVPETWTRLFNENWSFLLACLLVGGFILGILRYNFWMQLFAGAVFVMAIAYFALESDRFNKIRNNMMDGLVEWTEEISKSEAEKPSITIRKEPKKKTVEGPTTVTKSEPKPGVLRRETVMVYPHEYSRMVSVKPFKECFNFNSGARPLPPLIASRNGSRPFPYDERGADKFGFSGMYLSKPLRVEVTIFERPPGGCFS